MSNDTLWGLFNFASEAKKERPRLPTEQQWTAPETRDDPQDPFGELNRLTHVRP
jgi:hypothetical protein